MTAITIQIKKISTAVPPPSWPELSPGCSTTAVAPMAMPIEPMPSTTRRTRSGPAPARGARAERRGVGGTWPNSRASTRLSISSPIRSTRPSATAVS